MRTLIWITIAGLLACGDEQDDECETFECMGTTQSVTPGTGGPVVPTTVGSTAAVDTAGAPCTPDDNVCLTDEILRFCDVDDDELRDASCKAICGPDREAVGCGPGDNGYDVCFCADGGGDPPDPGCPDDFPVFCPGQHGVEASCWTAGASCDTVVRCGGEPAACGVGYAVDCTEKKCVPVLTWAESSNARCSNGVDDDGDGHADCGDYFCYVNPSVTVCHGESTDFECSNGADDDGDGYTDCDDIACQMSPAVTVCGPLEWSTADCTNGYDDDHDGSADCDDGSCYNPFTSICFQ